MMRKQSACQAALLLAVVLGGACGNDERRSESSADLLPAADTGTIVSGGFGLRYAIEGTGTPAIVVGSALYYPRAFSSNLRTHFRLVFVDSRGFAPSPGPRDTTAYSLDSLINDMEHIRETLDLGRIVVFGHSGHAFMALEYAKKYPGNVSHVVMIGIAPDLSAASAEATEQNWQATASAERKAVMEENLLREPDSALADLPPGQQFIRTYIRNGPRAWYNPRFDASPLWEGVDINMDMFGYVWGQVFRDIDITEGLDMLDRPVYVALGRYDYLVAPPSSWDRVQSAFNDLTIRIYEQSGHTPQYEEARVFDEELLAWIDSTR